MTMDKCTIMHTFKLTEMFITFNTESLSVTQSDLVALGKDRNKKDFAISVFKMSLEKVIDDIIDKGIQFQFPNTGQDQSYLCLERISGEKYTKLRKRGALKDFDPIETDFNAYRIEFKIERPNGTVYSVPIHLDRRRSQRIAKLASQHKIKVGRVKTYQDYYDYMASKLPTVSTKDIYKILRYGYNSFRLHLSYGGDIFITSSSGFLLQTGKIYTNWALMFQYVLDKMRIKSRVLYRRLHYLWDGYSYFSLSNEKYLAIKDDYNAGKVVDFGEVALLKCYDEAIATSFNRVALFRVRAGSEETRFLSMEHLVTDKAELIEIFHDWTWDTIRLSNRTYQTLFPTNISIQQIYKQNYKPYIKWLRTKRWKLLHK